MAASAFVFAPAAAQIPKLFDPLDQPTRSVARCVSYDTGAERVLEVPRSQHVTWYRPLSEPVRRVAIPPGTGAEFVFAPAVVVPTQLAWYQPLAEPARAQSAPIPRATGAEFVFAPTVTHLTWYRPLEEPRRLTRIVISETFGPVGVFPRTIAADIQSAIAGQPLAMPIRVPARAVDFSTGAESYTGPTIVSAVSTTVTGKYAPEHRSALAEVTDATGFAAEHKGAFDAVRDAGV
jgi:hypothetical protein